MLPNSKPVNVKLFQENIQEAQALVKAGKKHELIVGLGEYCTPDVARYAYNAIGLRNIGYRINHPVFNNVSGYLLKQAVSDLSYKEAMNEILNAFDSIDNRQIATLVLIDKLKNDKDFLDHFLNDDIYIMKYAKSLLADLEKQTKNDDIFLTIYSKVHEVIYPKIQPYCLEAMIQNFGFEKPLNDNETDILNIALFLNDIDLVMKQLGKLENNLEKHAGSRWDQINMTLIDFKEGHVLDHNKLFSSYLNDWARDNNYSHYAKLHGDLPYDTFFKMLENKPLLIDKAFRGFFHGEWIHVLQFWCLTEYDKEAHMLKSHPSELLQWMGKKGGQIWIKTFDTAGNDYMWPNAGWRDPVQFNKYLCSKECANRFPIIYQLIVGRALKEAKIDPDKPPYEIVSIPKKNNKQ